MSRDYKVHSEVNSLRSVRLPYVLENWRAHATSSVSVAVI
jgi:hypothetical protein